MLRDIFGRPCVNDSACALLFAARVFLSAFVTLSRSHPQLFTHHPACFLSPCSISLRLQLFSCLLLAFDFNSCPVHLFHMSHTHTDRHSTMNSKPIADPANDESQHSRVPRITFKRHVIYDPAGDDTDYDHRAAYLRLCANTSAQSSFRSSTPSRASDLTEDESTHHRPCHILPCMKSPYSSIPATHGRRSPVRKPASHSPSISGGSTRLLKLKVDTNRLRLDEPATSATMKKGGAQTSIRDDTRPVSRDSLHSDSLGNTKKRRLGHKDVSPRETKRPRESPKLDDQIVTASLEDLPIFNKVTGLLRQLLRSFDEIHNSQVSTLLEKARVAHRESPSTKQTSSATVSKDEQWTYEAGVKRAEGLYAVRRLPNQPQPVNEIWEVLFTEPLPAKKFYAKVASFSDHTCASLERQARAMVELVGGKVAFRRSYQQGFEASVFPEVPSKDVTQSLPRVKSATHFQSSQDVWLAGRDTGKPQVHTKTTETTPFTSDTIICPPFRWHRPAQSNVLAQNAKRLRVWPLMDADGTDEQQEMMEAELTERFTCVNPDTRRHNANPLLNLACKQLNDAVIQPFIKAVLRHRCSPETISEHDLILQYFLNTAQSLPQTLPAGICAAWAQRNAPIDRTAESWVLVASSLPDASSVQLAAATIACEAFEHETKISLWHWVRSYAEEILRRLVDGDSATLTAAESDMWCRICFVRNCFRHGLILEDPEDEDEDQPFLANMRQHIPGRPESPKHTLPIHLKRRDLQLSFPKTQPFMPCSHPGPCEDAKCVCFLYKRTCEKTCHCDYDCDRRFPGCLCAKNSRSCFKDACICYANDRECDADLCGKCGATEVLLDRGANPPHGCANVAIQRNIPKRLITGKSAIRGFGLFMGEPTKKHDFIAEYKGEIVSRDESDRRGVEYHYQAAQYLWGIDNEQDYDATSAGNKMRFPNHSGDRATINMYCKTKFCNGTWRVGFWASRTIQPGEELFFNYGYPEDHTRDFWEPGQNKGSSNVAARKSKHAPHKVAKVKPARSTSALHKAKAKSLRGLTTGPHVSWEDLRAGSDLHTVDDSEASSADSHADAGAQRQTLRRGTPSATRMRMAGDSLFHAAEETGAEGDDDMDDSDFDSERQAPTQARKRRKAGRPARYTR